MMMLEFFAVTFAVIAIIAGVWICWESTVMLSERKARYRAGTHDYYDNPIRGKTFDKSKVRYFDGDNT